MQRKVPVERVRSGVGEALCEAGRAVGDGQTGGRALSVGQGWIAQALARTAEGEQRHHEPVERAALPGRLVRIGPLDIPRARIPDGDSVLSDPELLDLGDETIANEVNPLIRESREDYDVVQTDFTVAVGTAAYRIPSRAQRA